MNKEQSHSQDTETRILEAAEKEFFEKGYAGARTTSIAEAAGVTHAMLHYYFRTKDNLFERIVSEKINMLGDIILSAIGDEDQPLEERIRQGVERHFDFIAANRDLPRFIVNEVLSHPEHIEMMKQNALRIVNNLLNNLQQEIDEYATQGNYRRIEARMLLIDIVSLNVFPFMAAPIVKGAIGDAYADYDEFLALRKKENVETILNKLKIR
ncbi:MAG TPA: TetR/AcrR family transcriptional regulator [Candidatus Bacteroides intestinavium]|uniref:TetR/AcrR family transcriptional regulator n=1 Tax=Candidatus Bacteroides intestinavium TaxID=2838469 RepID=A0A9D2HRM9_9BACE|nr:TetR/AcrR family transcriptional regulator [Candidatus Bacteroides intestinavium]